eukprot:270932-Chlamydomonas_euryale.AAC.2
MLLSWGCSLLPFPFLPSDAPRQLRCAFPTSSCAVPFPPSKAAWHLRPGRCAVPSPPTPVPWLPPPDCSRPRHLHVNLSLRTPLAAHDRHAVMLCCHPANSNTSLPLTLSPTTPPTCHACRRRPPSAPRCTSLHTSLHTSTTCHACRRRPSSTSRLSAGACS